ncbi:MAG: SDR family oxidoreductase [Gammaproteobacteria bacterium]|nr:SDR family oxidoreductase [Gammaproteobacteria bacterium]
MKIENSVIVITGAAQGLGQSMALYLAAKGAKLALIDLDNDKLSQAQSLCEQAGSPQVATYLCNVAKEDDVSDVFNRIVADFSAIHGLINNAGILRDGLLLKQKDGEFSKLPLSHWQSVIDVNLTGVFLCGREFAYHAAQLGQPGCIINISSISRAGNMGQSNYSAAKAGVATLSVVWAKELAQYGIRCNAIAPGFIRTDMTASIREDVLAKMTAMIPAKRMGEADEIAHSVAFLLENDYMNGRIIELDGGLRL